MLFRQGHPVWWSGLAERAQRHQTDRMMLVAFGRCGDDRSGVAGSLIVEFCPPHLAGPLGQVLVVGDDSSDSALAHVL